MKGSLSIKVSQTSLSTPFNIVGKNFKSQEAKITIKNPIWNQQAQILPLDLLMASRASSYFPPGFHELHHHLPPVTMKGMSIRSLGRCTQGAFHWLAQSVTILLSLLSESQAIDETSGFIISYFSK